MKRAALLSMILAACMIFGCTSKYTRGVSKTVCETWIYSSPQGARVYLNGHYVGRTPYKYTGINNGNSSAHFIARGLSEIVVRKRGYDDEIAIITIANCYQKLNIHDEGIEDQVKRYKGNITMYLDEKETPLSREYGNVVIEAVPQDPDAEIYINDNLVGNGKTSLLKLPAGSYVLKIRKPGYRPYARVFGVFADNDISIKAIMKKSGEESEPADILEAGIETGEIELSPAGLEAELEEDTVPGTIGGKE